MTIAMPVFQGRVSPVLDFAGQFLVVDTNGAGEVQKRQVTLEMRSPGSLVKGLKEIGAQVVICGAVSVFLETQLQNAGIDVESHLCGEADAVLQAYFEGTLDQPDFAIPGCWQRGSGNRPGRRCGHHGGHRWGHRRRKVSA